MYNNISNFFPLTLDSTKLSFRRLLTKDNKNLTKK